ncbi:MAG: thioredoxin domain-containing protein, partial [Chloroflexi bacterium]|nr:thioredoxin domain-containing protein [Chloroflexota bacterium]
GKSDGQAKLNGYMGEYSFLIDGLIALHEVTFDERWLREAISLGKDMVDLFWDEALGQFYDTGHDHEELIVRPRDTADNALPSGSSMAADVLLRLAVITGDSGYHEKALTALRSAREIMSRHPTGAGHWLCALDFYLSVVKEIAIIGDPGDTQTQALMSEVYRNYLPNRVFLGQGSDEGSLVGLPLLEDRGQINGRPTAYVCQNFICQLPVNEPSELAKQLAEEDPLSSLL